MRTTHRIIVFFLITVLSLSGIHSLQNGLARTPQMGWNSWNKFRCDVSEDLIKRTAHTIIDSGLAAKGYNYVNLDDCWQIGRDEKTGRILEDPERFPSGMKALADYVHSLGLKFGVYSDAGTMTCERRPGSLGYEDIDAQTYAEWGVDYLKYDNCYNTGVPGIERYTKMRDAIAKTGREILYSICSWGEEEVEKWAGDVGNSWRTTADIEDKWESFLEILDLQVGLEKYAHPGGWNDPDMLEVGNGGMTDSEYQAHFALWALLKSPLVIGCDVTDMSKSTYAILTNEEMIAINQDPLGKQGTRISRVDTDSGALEVWAGQQINGTVIMLLNRSGEKKAITANFRDCGYSHPFGYMVDIINHKQYGMVEDSSYTSEVEPHSVVAIRIHTECDDCSDIQNVQM